MQLIALPGILIGLFLLAVWWLIARCLNARIRLWHAQEIAATVPPMLLRQQATTIQDVIYELELNKVSYTGVFPDKLNDELIAAHSAWVDSSMGRQRDRKGIH